MIARMLMGMMLFAGLTLAADTRTIENNISPGSNVGREAWYELYIREPIPDPEKFPEVGWKFYSKSDTAEDAARRLMETAGLA